ncbi:MAG: ThuA domain-containing protein [Verrucomicrobia bacterium]|nr:ThuA domain-containing protein [Verrucomicrobiota bacterium]
MNALHPARFISSHGQPRIYVVLLAVCLAIQVHSSVLHAIGIEIFRSRVVFMIGEDEYRTAQTLPEFARDQLIPYHFDCLIIHANHSDPNDFPGLTGALEKADLLVLSVRRRTLKIDQMRSLQSFLHRGGALVGIRTASHAFGKVPTDEDHLQWDDFDRDVLGMDYEGHYNNKPPLDPPTSISIHPFWKDHCILKSLPSTLAFSSSAHLYKNRRPADGVSILISGNIQNNPDISEPVAWIYRNSFGGNVFYTSLGNPDDFQNPYFLNILQNAVAWAAGVPPQHPIFLD